MLTAPAAAVGPCPSLRRMKILVVDTYYSSFLDHARPRLEAGDLDYANMLQRLLAMRFGTSDYYSRNLRTLGHEADDLIYNCLPLQRRWLAEHRPSGARAWLSNLVEKATAPRRNLGGDELRTIAIEQIRTMRPDVLYMQELSVFPPQVLAELKQYTRLIVGQIASPMPAPAVLRQYDLILSSFPHFVGRFRSLGIASEYFRIGFDPIVLSDLGSVPRTRGCTFVGGISGVHGARTRFLEALARETDIEFFGYGADRLPADSAILKRHRGEAWALDMYRVLTESRITLNFHIDVAERNANNMRLYEATGCGALLLTDEKDNLHELFVSGVEVVTYKDATEAAEKISYYLDHPDETQRIASAGQARSLRDHTYKMRMVELAGILERHLQLSGPLPTSRLRQVLAAPLSAAFANKRAAATSSSDVTSRPATTPTTELVDSWKDEGLPERQWEVASAALARFERGEPVPVFDSLVDMLKTSVGRTEGMRLLEVGCSSGYYAEVLASRHPGLIYEGCDYSPAFIEMARRLYPDHRFEVADATRLDYGAASFDIVVSGCCLLHIPDYQRAISECARVSREWVIFHRTPVLQRRAHITFTKHAYGMDMFEQHFNEQSFVSELAKNRLCIVGLTTLEALWDNNASDCLTVKTYLCRKQP